MENNSSTVVPLRLGDDTAFAQNTQSGARKIVHDAGATLLEGFGSGDSSLRQKFLLTAEADTAMMALQQNGEVDYQQWYHMPDKKQSGKPLLKLRRLKRALANPTPDGMIPHYRFPVNDQNHYGVIPFTPTIQKIRDMVHAITGVDYNHCVVLLYRNGDDCIGFHKDKVIDLDEDAPIATVSLGAARPYVLRDDIFKPEVEEHLLLGHGSLLLLGPKTNQEFYHSIVHCPDGSAADFNASDNMIGPRVSITLRRVTTFKDDRGIMHGKGSTYQTLNWPEELKGFHQTVGRTFESQHGCNETSGAQYVETASGQS